MMLLRSADRTAYTAKGHHDVLMHHLAGPEAARSSFARIMHIRYDADGRVERSRSPDEKIYLCLSGKVAIWNDAERMILEAGDLCIVAPNEERAIENHCLVGSDMLLIMPRQ
jgi:quercetin dioxygenase-like cupin family protein